MHATTDPAATARAPTAFSPVATYLSADEATGARVVALRRARSIMPESVGSLGTTVLVEAAQADEARRVLTDAVTSEGLEVTVLRDLPSERQVL